MKVTTLVWVKGDGCRFCRKTLRPFNPDNKPLLRNGRKP